MMRSIRLFSSRRRYSNGKEKKRKMLEKWVYEGESFLTIPANFLNHLGIIVHKHPVRFVLVAYLIEFREPIVVLNIDQSL